jgi:hypothetical protein
MNDLRVEPSGSNDVGPCECCGAMSRTVWGYLYENGDARCVYYVQWTLDQVERHGANIDLLIGSWGEDATAEDRVAVSLEYRIGARGPEFASIDPGDREHAKTGLANHNIPGRHVLGNLVGADSYAFTHAILGQDTRVKEIVDAAQ